ncbi:MAG: DUF1343 domain-containing protein [Pseudarcicella sp.]|nr:DUF1343 domain-containing protein [Pseudarcicella sp.]MBP6410994.1 DUF1343 domain-containing protein [Pseudarcicella sp.]
MTKSIYNIILLSLVVLTNSFSQKSNKSAQPIIVGAAQTNSYLHLLTNKKIGLIVNHTSMIGSVHLVDSLLKLGIDIQTIFAPEHGFRGTSDAGEHIKNGIDTKSNLPIISLYGKNKKPTKAQLENLDLLIFDIQDVGARFYTYSSTLHYVMEACAENKKEILVLDRPNPNGDCVDGPVLDKKQASFVGLNPIPILHGCTLGELAQMINGEGWLDNKVKASLTVIPCLNYNHQAFYSPLIPPSPNLPNYQSIKLYASLCLFEGTAVSVGRGTNTQFQVIGAPNSRYGKYIFTPEDKIGAQNPLHEGLKCYGIDLRKENTNNLGFTLKYLIDFYKKSGLKDKFFNSFFDKLAGNDTLKKQIISNMSEKNIRATWKKDLQNYLTIRKKYLIYQ